MNRIALVTGAAGGIGLAACQALIADGWKIIGLDLHGPPNQIAPAEWITCDLAQAEDLESAMARLAGVSFGAIVLCAGIAGTAAAERVLRINFFAARRMLRTLAPRMANGGAITLLSSGAGWRWQDRREAILRVVREPDDAAALAQTMTLCTSPAEAYNLSKELLCALAAHDCLAQWSRGVRLNSVSPGSVATPLIAAFTASMGPEAMAFSRKTVGRDGTPDEIAAVIRFLSDPAARWINGADIKVDGGLVGALSAGAARFAGWE